MRARHRHLNPASAGATLALDSRFGFSQADGSAVSTWTDRTPTGNNATQATSGAQPTYETGEIGGQPVVRFDGTNDFLSFPTALFSYTGGATVIAIAKTTAGANEYGSIVAEFGGNSYSIGCQTVLFPNNAVEPCTDVYGPGGVRYNSTLTSGAAYLVGWHWSNWSTHKSNGDTRISVNGTETAGVAYGANPSGLSFGGRAIGKFDVGAGTGNFLQADLALLAKFPALGESLRRRFYHAAAFSFKLACN